MRQGFYNVQAMSLITRCPACETLFKVVPDQLRISEGWVRCGQCDEIFDASLHLLQVTPGEPVPAAPPEDGVTLNDGTVSPSDVVPRSVDADPDFVSTDRAGDVPMTSVQVLPEVAPDVATPDLEELAPAAAQTTASVSQLADDESDRVDGFDDVSFLRNHKSGDFWRQPLVRATLVVLNVLLLLGLTGQIVVHERDRIVALQPSLAPWLQAVCGPLKCALSPLRQIESIVIDSSSLTKIRGDAYRLNFTLKNTALSALATPAIELTLTDSLDQPVVRRIFLAPELGATSTTWAAGSELLVSLAVAVKAGGVTERIAGYRLLAFYP